MYYFVQEMRGSDSKEQVHTAIFANFDAAEIYARSLVQYAPECFSALIIREDKSDEPIAEITANA